METWEQEVLVNARLRTTYVESARMQATIQPQHDEPRRLQSASDIQKKTKQETHFYA